MNDANRRETAPTGLRLPVPGGHIEVRGDAAAFLGGWEAPLAELGGGRVALGWRGAFPAWEASLKGRVLASTRNPFRAWSWAGQMRRLGGLAALSESHTGRRRLLEFSAAAEGASGRYLTSRDLALAREAWGALSLFGPGAAASAGAKAEPDERAREEANRAFLAAEGARWAGFLDAVERMPLSDDQRRAVLENDHRVQIVASAGSGKTSVVVSKVGYLVESGFAKPEEILVLAFNRKAADELASRMSSRLGATPDVRTFHGLGLDLVGKLTGKKPRMHPAAEDDGEVHALIAKILLGLAESGRVPWLSLMVSAFQAREQDPQAVDAGLGEKGDRAYKVRSPQEAALCGVFDYLKGAGAISGWEYEAEFKKDTRDASHGQYRPDFTLTVPGSLDPVYWEHFALSSDGTSSFGDAYVKSVDWKRRTHSLSGTRFVESHSWWWKDGSWASRVTAALAGAGVDVSGAQAGEGALVDALKAAAAGASVAPRSRSGTWEERRKAALDPSDPGTVAASVARLLRLVASCVALMRERGLEAFPRAVPHRAQVLAGVVETVAAEYARTMESGTGSTDFPAMVADAARLARLAPPGSFPWKAVLVDEFQDISPGRFALLKAVLDNVPEARLTCVGDDWQSIYRFAGADVGIMTGLSRAVGHPVLRLDVTRTYRCAQAIASAAARFVQKNPGQMRKSPAGSPGQLERPICALLTDESPGAPGTGPLDAALAAVSAALPGRRPEVLVLSRYNRGIPDADEQEAIRSRHPSASLRWSTVHKAKGQEADAVVVTGLFEGPKGFPASGEEHPVLSALLAEADKLEFAEERRLFYVALTRARHFAVLLGPTSAPSRFVEEILADRAGAAAEVRDGVLGCKRCPKCSKGHVVARDGGAGRFFSCNNWPSCGHTEAACPSCKAGLLMPTEGGKRCSDPGCGFVAPGCPRCRKGTLVRRRRKADGKPFWGCDRYTDEPTPCKYTRDLSAAECTPPDRTAARPRTTAELGAALAGKAGLAAERP